LGRFLALRRRLSLPGSPPPPRHLAIRRALVLASGALHPGDLAALAPSAAPDLTELPATLRGVPLDDLDPHHRRRRLDREPAQLDHQGAVSPVGPTPVEAMVAQEASWGEAGSRWGRASGRGMGRRTSWRARREPTA
jgi:hypothetical protein